MASWVSAGRAENLAPGKVRMVFDGRNRLAVCNVDNNYYCIDDVCTHDGGSLDQGELEGTEIECPRHGARFDIRSGAATQLPAFEPVETHAVRVEGDTIQVSVEHQ